MKLSQKILLELLKIDSDSQNHNEIKIVDYIHNLFQEKGFNPQKVKVEGDRSNLYLKGNNPYLFICHLDVVPVGDINKWKYNPYGEIANGKIYGRGACDNKGNAATIISSLLSLKENVKEELKFPSVLFTIGEEVNMAGVQHFTKNPNIYEKGFNKEVAIVFEPTQKNICYISKGIITFDIIARGISAHSSRPDLGESAIDKIGEIISKHIEYKKKISKITYKNLGSATSNLGIINAGTAFNIIPDYGIITGERRVLPNENPDKIIEKLKELANIAEIKINLNIPPAKSNPDSLEFKLIRNKLKKIIGSETLTSTSGTTELSYISRDLNIESFVFGFGDLNLAHKEDEHIKIQNLEEGEKILCELINNQQ